MQGLLPHVARCRRKRAKFITLPRRRNFEIAYMLICGQRIRPEAGARHALMPRHRDTFDVSWGDPSRKVDEPVGEVEMKTPSIVSSAQAQYEARLDDPSSGTNRTIQANATKKRKMIKIRGIMCRAYDPAIPLNSTTRPRSCGVPQSAENGKKPCFRPQPFPHAQPKASTHPL